MLSPQANSLRYLFSHQAKMPANWERAVTSPTPRRADSARHKPLGLYRQKSRPVAQRAGQIVAERIAQHMMSRGGGNIHRAHWHVWSKMRRSGLAHPTSPETTYPSETNLVNSGRGQVEDAGCPTTLAVADHPQRR